MSNGSESTVALVWLVIVIMGGMWLFDSEILNRGWQALKNSTSYGSVLMADKPHDCDFLTAPIGKKNCDYDKVVTKVKWWWTDDVSKRSLDDGKTWEVRVPGTCDYDTSSFHCRDATDPRIGEVPTTPTTTGVYINWQREKD